MMPTNLWFPLLGNPQVQSISHPPPISLTDRKCWASEVLMELGESSPSTGAAPIATISRFELHWAFGILALERPDIFACHLLLLSGNFGGLG